MALDSANHMSTLRLHYARKRGVGTCTATAV